ncbi:MAG TPA: hypothetical protein VGV17_03135 [Bosea sp. (in: a-proteobacteria)]|uniref:hypothetical protein n=1 Tax=Bosea sp. (in: a-proteobacteria) TaxID=1871050 RepID=UPI002DDD4EF9|nr:hypothetical protein [Bosea sp. (in: a-proteobacteria)]HEV2552740.1 hypothetical protein [Bosea sp. (in: a-proteobacteria)]
MLTPSPIYVPRSCRRMAEPETPRSLAARLIARRDIRTAIELTALGLFVGGVLAASIAAGA